ncbi:MAG: hypothetical protein WCP98_18920 [Actinomycetes bacterium]
MTSVGSTELKARLGAYLRGTQAGERFHVTPGASRSRSWGRLTL